MKLGFSTLYWSGAPGPDLLPWLARLKEWGYDGVELPVVGVDDATLDRLREALDEVGLARTAVGFATPEANPVSPDAAVRRAAEAHLVGLVEKAHRLGAEVLGGPVHSAYGVFTGRGPAEEERARCAEVLHAAAEAAGERGLRLGVEFLNRFECYFATTAAETNALVERVGHPALCTVYDTHHAHIEERDPTTALRSCAPTLGHVQVSESHRGVLGTGQVRWEETFEALRAVGYDGWLVVESFSRVDPDFGALLRIWRDLSAGAAEVARPAVGFVRERWGRAGG